MEKPQLCWQCLIVHVDTGMVESAFACAWRQSRDPGGDALLVRVICREVWLSFSTPKAEKVCIVCIVAVDGGGGHENLWCVQYCMVRRWQYTGEKLITTVCLFPRWPKLSTAM